MKKTLLGFLVLAFVVAFTHSAAASGYEKKGSGYMKGDSDKGSMAKEMAEGAEMGGLCPVCVFKGKFMKGTDAFKAEYEGKTYYFVGQEQLDTFLEDPAKYLEDFEAKAIELKKEYKKKMKEGKGSMKGSDHDHHGSDHEHKGSY